MGICCSKDENTSRGFQNNSNISESRRVTNVVGMANWKNIKYEPNIHNIYDIGKALGEGSFGTVNRCTRKAVGTDVVYAIKSIKKSSLQNNENLPKLMKNELTILQ